MGDSFSRILIQTTVRKAIRDIRETPQRSTRNLIDMAVNFSTGRFHQEFFRMAQKMLTDESSAYYALLQDMAMHIDEDRLLSFGMNVGYNSGVCGARHIRRLEQSLGYNIPWSLSFEITAEGIRTKEAHYHALIEAGEKMGIFTWIFFSCSCASECIELAAEHPHSAFTLFCAPGEIDCALIDRASDVNNLMLAVPMDEDVSAACSLLREAGMLYSLYTTYAEADLHRIQNGDQFCDMEQLHPVFSVFIPRADCPLGVRDDAYDAIQEARLAQTHATMLWEFRRDCMLVDKIVSDDVCWACFDADGIMHSIDECGQAKTFGSMDEPLEELFRQAFPKAQSAG